MAIAGRATHALGAAAMDRIARAGGRPAAPTGEPSCPAWRWTGSARCATARSAALEAGLPPPAPPTDPCRATRRALNPSTEYLFPAVILPYICFFGRQAWRNAAVGLR
jgi:hypothetical protein